MTPASVEVLDTDITTLAVDVIAVAVAAAADVSVAGATLALGDVAATRAGDGASRWVVHAALDVPATADVVRRATAATLWKAEELGARSLALPAFGAGAGAGGFPLADAAAIEVEEVRGHVASGSRLERIVFAVDGEEAARELRAALDAAPAT